MEDTVEIQDEKQESITKQLEFISGSAMNNLYSHANNIYKLSTNGVRARRISRKQIRNALANPYANVDALQQASRLFRVTSGVYNRLINFQGNMLTNYHTLIPYNISKITSSEKIQEAFVNTAMFLQRYNVIRTSSWIESKVIEQGELFTYKIEDESGIIHMEIPSNICKVTDVVNDVSRYAVSLSSISDTVIDAYPLEIQKAYKSYTNGKLKANKLIDNEYYQISDKGTAFCLNKFIPKNVPFYTSVFDDLMELEDMKDLKSSTAVINNLKIIHQLLPTDSKTGDVLMNFDVAQAYHRDTAGKVPKGSTVVTNPMKISTVTTTDGNAKLSDCVREAVNSIFDGAGVSVELFNSSKSSNEAVASGLTTDSLVPLEIQRQIAAWLNYELATFNKENGIWQVRFIDGMTHFNKEAYVKLARESMSFGSDKLTFFACNGLTPLETINTLKMESMLGFIDMMTPVKSSHTTSSGRPSKEDNGGVGQSTKPLTEE